MRHRTSGPLVRARHRLGATTGRLRGKQARRVAFRSLVILVVTLSLGGGAYAVGTLLVGGSPSRPAASAVSTTPQADESPAPTSEVPGPGHRTPDATGPGPSAPPTGSPEAPDPTTSAPSTVPGTPATSAMPGTPAMPEPRSSTGQPAGSPGPAAATPSTSPTQPSATPSATPVDDTPPQTHLSEEYPAVDAAQFSFSADEPATFTCSLDGAAYTSCGALALYTDLDPGWHTFAVRATDPAGNVDPSPAATRWHATNGHSGL